MSFPLTICRVIVGMSAAWLGAILPAGAQSSRAEVPGFLVGGLAEVTIGRIDYRLQTRLPPGLSVESIDVPDVGTRVTLGRRLFGPVSAHLVYQRPIYWARFRNVDGDGLEHAVWTNVFGATLRATREVVSSVSAYGEVGAAAVTRSGFQAHGREAVADAVYAAPLLGFGLEYTVHPRWGLNAGVTYLPGREADSHPRTVLGSTGVTYRFTGPNGPPPLDPERETHGFPEQLVQLGYTTNKAGYGYNRAMRPIFWLGDAKVSSGASLHYQRNVYHTEKVFSIDWGASLTYGQSEVNRDRFWALSLYPLFRWTLLRTGPLDLYFAYSALGPTLISEYILDGHDTGKHFTFQDLIGIGIYAGPARHLNLELRIGHYSNANVLPQNAGIRIPLTFTLGYAY